MLRTSFVSIIASGSAKALNPSSPLMSGLYRMRRSQPNISAIARYEKASATHQPTVEECMASWDDKTHITKTSWRLICERQIKDNE